MLLILYNIFQPLPLQGYKAGQTFSNLLVFQGYPADKNFRLTSPRPRGTQRARIIPPLSSFRGTRRARICQSPFPLQGYTAGKNFPTPFPLQGYTAGKIVQPNSPFRDTRRARIRPRWMKFSENLNQIFAFSLTKTCPLLSSFKTVFDGTLFVRIPFGSYKF